MSSPKHLGIDDYSVAVHGDNSVYFAVRKHAINFNTSKEYTFPAVLGRVGSVKSYSISSGGLGLNSYSSATKDAPGAEATSSRPSSFWYALADSIIDLYTFADYRAKFAAGTAFTSYFETVWKDRGANRREICKYLGDHIVSKFPGNANLDDISTEYQVTIVTADLVEAGDMYKYRDGTSLNVNSKVPIGPSNFAAFVAKVGRKYRRVERLDGIHGTYFRYIKRLEHTSPESDAAISAKIADMNTETSGKGKRIRIYELADLINAKIASPISAIEASELTLFKNGFIIDNDIMKYSSAKNYRTYYAMDKPGDSPLGNNDSRLLHDFLHRLNIGEIDDDEVDAELFLNDGVYYKSSDKDTAWNTDKTVNSDSTFFISMAEELLDNIFSNPFYSATHGAVFGTAIHNDKLYNIRNEKHAEYGRIKGNDIWGISRYEAARDQLAHDIRIATGTLDNAEYNGTSWSSIATEPITTTVLAPWGVSMKLFSAFIGEKSIKINGAYSYYNPGTDIFMVTLFVSNHAFYYFRGRKINNFDFNPLPYFNIYDYGATGVLRDNLIAAIDKRVYLNSTVMTPVLVDPAHAKYLKETTARAAADLNPSTVGVYYMADITEYPIDQIDYDKITDHIIKLNTLSKQDLIFDMWFDNHSLEDAVASLDDSLAYALAKGFYRLIKKNRSGGDSLYTRHRGNKDLFPGASNFHMAPQSFYDLYNSSLSAKDKIKFIYLAIKSTSFLSDNDAARVVLLNSFDVRLTRTHVKHSRTGAMYILPTIRDNSPGPFGSLGSRAADYYAGGTALDMKMTAPMNFAIVLANVDIGGGFYRFSYVDVLDGSSDVIPTTYISKVPNSGVKMGGAISDIWERTGEDKKIAIKNMYDANKNSGDGATARSIKFYYRERYDGEKTHYIDDYDNSVYRSKSKYESMLHRVIRLNTHGCILEGFTGKTFDTVNKLIAFALARCIGGTSPDIADTTDIAKELLAGDATSLAIIDNWGTSTNAERYAVKVALKNKIDTVLGKIYTMYVQNEKINCFGSDGKFITNGFENIVTNVFKSRAGLGVTCFRDRHGPAKCPDEYRQPFYVAGGHDINKHDVIRLAIADKELRLPLVGTLTHLIKVVDVPDTDINDIREIVAEENPVTKKCKIKSFFSGITPGSFWENREKFYRYIPSSPPLPSPPSPPPPSPSSKSPPSDYGSICRGSGGSMTDSYILTAREADVVCALSYAIVQSLITL